MTFLFTDLEGSTRLWEENPEAMRAALARHDEILRDTVEGHGGHVVKTTGDGLHAAFATAHDGLGAAIAAQGALVAEDWSLPEPLQVRMGLHSGEADVRDGDYYGPAVNRGARVAAVAHGGQIVLSRATEELARDGLGNDVSLVDLGDHQLRDLARPEHVFQINTPGLRIDFPPLRSLDAFPGNLPSRPTSFVGRDGDLRKVAEALERAPVVTVTGVGGVGKTRLALQVAAEVVPHYPDGAWLCELATADGPAALMQVIAASLGVPLRSGMDPADSVLEFLKAKQLLVVLDNCEHLIDSAGAFAERVVQTCPDVRMLATSREGLAIEGEQVVPLRSLALPDEDADPDGVTSSAAVRLFVERAGAAQSGFELRSVDLSAVAEVCRRLDGIPLAIELAAARVVAMTPTEIAGLLDERFRLLTGGRRTAVERHQTLRATVDWSYSLLDERDRTVFDRLGVFAGTFGGDAAAVVGAGDGVERFDVLDSLSDLVAKSLVVAEPAEDGTTRYALLETLRQYARERLDEAGAGDTWRRRHAEHYAEFCEAIAPVLLSPGEIAARRHVQTELDNLRAAVGWALDRDDRDDNELGVRIAAALFTEASMGRAAGISAWAVRALPFIDSTTPLRRYEILACVAFDAHAQGDMDRCREFSLAALRDGVPDDLDYCVMAHTALAGAYAMVGNLAEALRVFDEALELVEARGAPEYVRANTLAIIAMHRLGNRDVEGGRRDAEEAAALAQRSRNPSTMVLSLFALGWSLCQDEPDRAIKTLSETIRLCDAGAIDAVLAPARCLRATLRLQTGQLEHAIPDLRAGFECSVEIGDILTIGAAATATVPALVQAGVPETAAVILGALDQGVIPNFETSGYGVFEVAGLHPQVQSALSEKGRYERAHARGAAMTYDDAVAFVRGALDGLSTQTPVESA